MQSFWYYILFHKSHFLNYIISNWHLRYIKDSNFIYQELHQIFISQERNRFIKSFFPWYQQYIWKKSRKVSTPRAINIFSLYCLLSP